MEIYEVYGKLQKHGPEKTPYLNTFHTVFHSPVYTYLHLLIHTYVLFILLYEFDKIDEIWEIQKLRRNFLD